LFVEGVCDTIEPALTEYGADHTVACHVTTGHTTARERVSV
jgi:hypothetical protein